MIIMTSAQTGTPCPSILILIKIIGIDIDILHLHIVTNYTYLFQWYQQYNKYNINSYLFEWYQENSILIGQICWRA